MPATEPESGGRVGGDMAIPKTKEAWRAMLEICRFIRSATDEERIHLAAMLKKKREFEKAMKKH